MSLLFRNLTLFRLPRAYCDALDAQRIDTALAAIPLQDPGPMELASAGFVDIPGLGGAYTFADAQGRVMFRIGAVKRLLPSVAISAQFNARLAEIRANENREPGTRERRKLRDETVLEMIPRAFLMPSRLSGIFDLRNGWLLLDTASRRIAEAAVSLLRGALGSMPAVPPDPQTSPRLAFTSWLRGDASPAHATLAIGTTCVLEECVEAGARIAARDQELFCEEIGKHLEAGKFCTALELNIEGRVSFSIDESLTVRRIVWNDEALQSDEEKGEEDAQAAATATLCMAALADLVQVIATELDVAEAGP